MMIVLYISVSGSNVMYIEELSDRLMMGTRLIMILCALPELLNVG